MPGPGSGPVAVSWAYFRSAATRSEGSSAPRTRRQKKLFSKKKFDAEKGLPLTVDTVTAFVHASEIALEDGGKADELVVGEGEWGGNTRKGGGAAAMDVDEEEGWSGRDGTGGAGEHLSSLPDESSRVRDSDDLIAGCVSKGVRLTCACWRVRVACLPCACAAMLFLGLCGVCLRLQACACLEQHVSAFGCTSIGNER